MVLLDDVSLGPQELRGVLSEIPQCGVVIGCTRPLLGRLGRSVPLTGLAADTALEVIRNNLRRDLTDRERNEAVGLCVAIDGGRCICGPSSRKIGSACPSATPMTTGHSCSAILRWDAARVIAEGIARQGPGSRNARAAASATLTIIVEGAAVTRANLALFPVAPPPSTPRAWRRAISRSAWATLAGLVVMAVALPSAIGASRSGRPSARPSGSPTTTYQPSTGAPGPGSTRPGGSATHPGGGGSGGGSSGGGNSGGGSRSGGGNSGGAAVSKAVTSKAVARTRRSCARVGERVAAEFYRPRMPACLRIHRCHPGIGRSGDGAVPVGS
jgi:uncharacterized membrane protein YgcG